ncbi:hypothetical protein DFH29DRAFT_1006945 [Suillus ampliporus]|nr:hypothetical protein DFH29DRAFT_1006945 [Suillus ampliporus]
MPPSHAPIVSTTLASPTDPAPHTNITRTLAKSPAFAGVSAERIIENHGATDFLGSLTTFLQKHIPSMEFKPVLHDRFDIYRQVVITAPPNTCANEAARRFRIHATPAIKANPRSQKQGSPAKFDMALLSFEDAASPAAREGDLTGKPPFKLFQEYDHGHSPIVGTTNRVEGYYELLQSWVFATCCLT